MRKFGKPPVQVVPPSVLRAPVPSVPRRTEESDRTASDQTAVSGKVLTLSGQLPPPSVLRKRPRFVPAYSVCGEAGSTARAKTFTAVRPELERVQLPAAPLFVLL